MTSIFESIWDFITNFITYILPTVIMLTIIGGILYLRKYLSRGYVKSKLKLGIKVMGSTLTNSLKEEFEFNKLLKQYLTSNSETDFNKMAEALYQKGSISKYCRVTKPAAVLRALMKAIIEEQLNTTYNEGYYILDQTISSLCGLSPFAKEYCFIVQKEGGVYIDFIYCRIEENLDLCISLALKKFFDHIITKDCVDYDKLYVPPTIIGLLSSCVGKYYYVVPRASFMAITTPKGDVVHLKGLIARSGYFTANYKSFGGDYFTDKEDKEIASYCRCQTIDSYSVIVYKKS